MELITLYTFVEFGKQYVKHTKKSKYIEIQALVIIIV